MRFWYYYDKWLKCHKLRQKIAPFLDFFYKYIHTWKSKHIFLSHEMKFGSWWSALIISWKWYICLFTPINSSNCLHSPNLRIFSLWKHWNVRNVNPFMKMSFKTHSVEITLRFSLTHFWQKSRESNGFTKEITKELIWRNIFFMRLNFQFFHTVRLPSHSVEITEIYSHSILAKISWNQRIY